MLDFIVKVSRIEIQFFNEYDKSISINCVNESDSVKLTQSSEFLSYKWILNDEVLENSTNEIEILLTQLNAGFTVELEKLIN